MIPNLWKSLLLPFIHARAALKRVKQAHAAAVDPAQWGCRRWGDAGWLWCGACIPQHLLSSALQRCVCVRVGPQQSLEHNSILAASPGACARGGCCVFV